MADDRVAQKSSSGRLGLLATTLKRVGVDNFDVGKLLLLAPLVCPLLAVGPTSRRRKHIHVLTGFITQFSDTFSEVAVSLAFHLFIGAELKAKFTGRQIRTPR